MEKPINSCNICGNSIHRTLFVGKDLLHHIEGTFRIVECVNCHLCYLCPMPSLQKIQQYYPKDYKAFAKISLSRIKSCNQLATYYGLKRKCREVTNMRKPPGRLLDIGCATGGFLKMMASYGWKVYGVELNEESAGFAKREQNLNIVNGDFLEVDFPVGFFDVVTLWNVLEHLIDPSAVLKKISSLLKKNGILIYVIPNIDSLGFTVFHRWWGGWEVPRHLYTFSFYSMTLLAKKSNFRIIKTKCFCGGCDCFLMSLHNFLEAKCRTAVVKNCIMKIVQNFSFRVISLPFFYLFNLFKKGAVIAYYLKKEE